MRRRTCGFGFSTTLVTVYAGVALPKARKASSRIVSIRPVRLRVLATVKSHASWRSRRRTPANARSKKIRSIAGRRDSKVASVVR